MYPRSAKWLCCIIVALTLARASARDKPDVWLEVRTPHFLVATNGNEKQGRRIADQFERIREVFHKAFPQIKVDPAAPILILAAKNKKTFDTMVPKEWLQKGALERTGFFLRGPEKNYVLLRLDSGSDQLYHLLYHEYTHLIVDQIPESIPLWLNEGLAEFYGNSIIGGKDVSLGRPDENHLQLLRQSKLLPLETLFSVDHASPYYNENNKGSIFYAESWAVTHMLVMRSFEQNRSMINEFLSLLDQKVDTRSAAARAFGDLDTLQKDLLDYLQRPAFRVFQMKAEIESDVHSYAVKEMTAVQSDALRGDFLIYNQRYDEARALLLEALKLDPQSAEACESLGYLEFQQNHPEEAKKWFTRAVHLNSQSYFAHYYFAVMMLRDSQEGEQRDEIRESLRKAIEIKPDYAPAYRALASFYANHSEDLGEAYRTVQKAIQLEPGNVYTRLTEVQILLQQQRGQDALLVAQRAANMAHNMDELNAAQITLASAQSYVAYLDQMKRAEADAQAGIARLGASGATQEAVVDATGRPILRHRNQITYTITMHEENPIKFHSDPAQRGKRDTLTGTIKDVKCSLPAVMQMTFAAGKQTIELFSENYFSVEYAALNFTPSGELLPCQDLKGQQAQIYFYDLKDHPNQGELISVQLRK
jgi:tetratricopeptide (TPR) repeat protein